MGSPTSYPFWALHGAEAGSGGTGETPNQLLHILAKRACARAAELLPALGAFPSVRLEPVLGGFWFYVLAFGVRASASDCADPTIQRMSSCTTAAAEP